VTAGQKAAVVESVKAAEDVLAPISGTVVAVNSDLFDHPENVNGDPYGAWFFKVEVSSGTARELAALMDSDAYDKFVDANAH
jgi:glycine cleavage system H protein